MRRFAEFFVVLAVVAVLVTFLYRTEEPQPSPTTPTPIATTSAITYTPQPVPPIDRTGLVPLQGPSGLLPLAHRKNAPELSEKRLIQVRTSVGDFTIETFPQAAPRAEARFAELVQAGFYDGVPVSRVVDDFVVQFGINHTMAEWKEKNIDDDPSYFQLLPGTIAFAKAGSNTATTQVFINLTENNRLAEPSMNFTVFGRVIEGMETVEKFESFGDPSGGLDQDSLWNDPDYLDGLEQKPTMITSMTILE
jgi:cyclophilin family peptidyl-prolyl cis-trans isomerase